MLTDGAGIPLSVSVAAANTHDKWLVEPTLKALAIKRPEPTTKQPQHICMDKGYDYTDVREMVSDWGYTAHIKTRGEEANSKKKIPGYRSRRWVVERTHSWFNRFRRLLIRWEKKTENYEALLHFACACITYRSANVLG